MSLSTQIESLQRQILAIQKRLATLVTGGTVNPAKHAATHSDGGSDEVDVTNLGGYPGGNTNFLREDGTFAAPSGSGITTLTGDVAAGPGSGSQAATIANDAVTNAKAANMAQATVKGRAVAAGTGDPTDLTATQATAIFDVVVGDSGSGGTKGLAPAPAAGDAAAGKFLKADATYAVPPGTGGTYTDEQAQDAVGGILDNGTVGDANFTYDDATPKISAVVKNDAITYAKMQNVSAASRLLGRGSAGGSGDVEEITLGTGLSMSSTTLSASGSAPGSKYFFGITIGNGVDDITTGFKGLVRLPIAGAITKWTMLSSDPSQTAGDFVLDVWKGTYASLPLADADSITGGNEPEFTNDASAEDSTLTSWSPAVTAGDVVGWNVDACTGIKRVTWIGEVTVS